MKLTRFIAGHEINLISGYCITKGDDGCGCQMRLYKLKCYGTADVGKTGIAHTGTLLHSEARQIEDFVAEEARRCWDSILEACGHEVQSVAA